jgi:putative ATP-dependent endonuclease of OLD family
MKIKQVRIENFRVFEDVTIPFDNYACLIGANGAGKSSILCALNLFFRQTANASTDILRPQAEDFHAKNVDNPIRITVTFTDLSPEARTDFQDYVRQGELIISSEARFDAEQGCATVKQYGQRKGMEQFREYFELDKAGAKADELKAVYTTMRSQFKELPSATTKQAMRDQLLHYEAQHSGDCVDIPSADEFYGFSKGTNRLNKYVQWVFVPAVKDAVAEQSAGKNTALSQILDRAVKARTGVTDGLAQLKEEAQGKYREILSQHQGALGDLSNELAQKFRQWAHPDASLKLEWQEVANPIGINDPLAAITAKEGDFEGQLARFGHGLQRSYLFALLHVLSNADDSQSPTLILGCEEPELYQHPPQLRHLVDVFKQLTVKNSQVILCTHSPIFVTGIDFEDVRLIQKNQSTGRGSVAQVAPGELAEEITKAYAGKRPPEKPEAALLKLHQILQSEINEMFFAPVVVFVEGREDLAFLSTYLHLMGQYESFRQFGCHLVSCGGKSCMDRPLAVANRMCIRKFVVFDSDGDTEGEKRTSHESWNTALLRLSNHEEVDAFPGSVVWKRDLIVLTLPRFSGHNERIGL